MVEVYDTASKQALKPKYKPEFQHIAYLCQ